MSYSRQIEPEMADPTPFTPHNTYFVVNLSRIFWSILPYRYKPPVFQFQLNQPLIERMEYYKFRGVVGSLAKYNFPSFYLVAFCIVQYWPKLSPDG